MVASTFLTARSVFVGYSADDKSLDADTLRKHIYGGHVAEYMEEMQEEAPEKYQVICCAALHMWLMAPDMSKPLSGCLLQRPHSLTNITGVARQGTPQCP